MVVVHDEILLPCQWTKNVAAIEPSYYSCWRVSPDGTQDGGRMPPSSSQPPSHGAPWGDSGWKAQDRGPKELRYTSKEWFQWAQTSHLPIHRKALDSLTWYIWFRLVYSNCLMFPLSGIHCKKTPKYPGSSPSLLLWNIFSGLAEMLPPGIKSLVLSVK